MADGGRMGVGVAADAAAVVGRNRHTDNDAVEEHGVAVDADVVATDSDVQAEMREQVRSEQVGRRFPEESGMVGSKTL